ncbi:hypothetical protein [Caulobacter sp. RL271]|jgi:hypothetical protein|uniref:Uncharacterized protein n=1 Tax=Caulobacter segnis TaxID=88688 RepID=A0ABY4ZYV1_9CAUL|nr:hypothetical protein [Caulobacter segnis]USQ97950.1 hypothetical protein MZV50_10590 [Caulobacter segnis]
MGTEFSADTNVRPLSSIRDSEPRARRQDHAGPATVTRLAEHRTVGLAPPPVFFASRMVAEGRGTRVVEYCVVDILGAVKLMVTVTWNAEPSRPGTWTPTSPALAAVLLIGQLFRRCRVVVARHLEDETLQPLQTGALDLDLIEMGDILDRHDAGQAASGLDGQIERLRADAARPDNAHGDALLLKACWSLVDAHLRGRRQIPTGFRPLPRTDIPFQPIGWIRTDARALVWWLGAALLIQICVSSALWLLPGG